MRYSKMSERPDLRNPYGVKPLVKRKDRTNRTVPKNSPISPDVRFKR